MPPAAMNLVRAYCPIKFDRYLLIKGKYLETYVRMKYVSFPILIIYIKITKMITFSYIKYLNKINKFIRICGIFQCLAFTMRIYFVWVIFWYLFVFLVMDSHSKLHDRHFAYIIIKLQVAIHRSMVQIQVVRKLC